MWVKTNHFIFAVYILQHVQHSLRTYLPCHWVSNTLLGQHAALPVCLIPSAPSQSWRSDGGYPVAHWKKCPSVCSMRDREGKNTRMNRLFPSHAIVYYPRTNSGLSSEPISSPWYSVVNNKALYTCTAVHTWCHSTYMYMRSCMHIRDEWTCLSLKLLAGIRPYHYVAWARKTK